MNDQSDLGAREETPLPGQEDELRSGRIARNVFLNFIGLVVPYVVAFVAVPFTIRWLGLDRFGVLSLVMVVLGYFGVFDLGLGRTTTKYIAEALGRSEHGRIPGYFWTTAFIQTALGLFAFAVLAAIAPLVVRRFLNIPPELVGETVRTIRLVASSLPIMFVTTSVRGALEAAQRFEMVNVVKIPANVLFYALPVLGALAGLKLPGIILLLVISRLAALVAWSWLCFRVFPALRTNWRLDRGYLRPLFVFSGWVTLSGLLWIATTTLDRILIGAMLDVKAVGYYTAPFEALQRLGVIPSSFAFILFPAFSFLAARESRERAETLFSRSTRYLLLTTGPMFILLGFYAHPFLRLWLGSSFAAECVFIVQILAAGFLVNAVSTVAYSYLQGIGRVDITTKYMIFELVFFSAALAAGIRLGGINGAAAVSAVRLAANPVYMFWRSFKIGHIRFPSFLAGGGLPGIVLVLGAYALGLGICRVTGLALPGGVVLTIGLAAVIYFRILNDQERGMAASALRRFLPWKKNRPA